MKTILALVLVTLVGCNTTDQAPQGHETPSILKADRMMAETRVNR